MSLEITPDSLSEGERKQIGVRTISERGCESDHRSEYNSIKTGFIK